MSKGERITEFVEGLEAGAATGSGEVRDDPYYRAFFRCWNEQKYYEAHDVLEHLWLRTTSADGPFFKGLIQAAGGFVHLEKHFAQPDHPKHGRRLAPAVRLFAMAEQNLEPFGACRHGLNVDGLRALLARTARAIVDGDFQRNPWSPENAPRLVVEASR